MNGLAANRGRVAREATSRRLDVQLTEVVIVMFSRLERLVHDEIKRVQHRELLPGLRPIERFALAMDRHRLLRPRRKRVVVRSDRELCRVAGRVVEDQGVADETLVPDQLVALRPDEPADLCTAALENELPVLVAGQTLVSRLGTVRLERTGDDLAGKDLDRQDGRRDQTDALDARREVRSLAVFLSGRSLLGDAAFVLFLLAPCRSRAQSEDLLARFDDHDRINIHIERAVAAPIADELPLHDVRQVRGSRLFHRRRFRQRFSVPGRHKLERRRGCGKCEVPVADAVVGVAEQQADQLAGIPGARPEVKCGTIVLVSFQVDRDVASATSTWRHALTAQQGMAVVGSHAALPGAVSEEEWGIAVRDGRDGQARALGARVHCQAGSKDHHSEAGCDIHRTPSKKSTT